MDAKVPQGRTKDFKKPESIFTDKTKFNLKTQMKSNGGQIVIEYMLLLVIAVAISAILVRGLANRGAGQEGIVVKRWLEIQQEIGEELPDKCSADRCAQ